MAAKKKLVKKSKPAPKRRPSIARAPRSKPEPKPCCGRLRGHAPDCTGGESPGALPGVDPVEAAGHAVAQEDSEQPVQPGPYLSALRGIEESLAALVSLLTARGPAALLAAPSAPGEPARKPRKAKGDPEAAPATGEAQTGAQEPSSAAPAAPPAPAKAYKAPRPCPDCGKDLDNPSVPHSSGCPASATPAPAATPSAPATPAAAPTMEQVRSAFLSFASAKGRDAAVALLGKFGAARVAEVPAARFGEFVAALKEV